MTVCCDCVLYHAARCFVLIGAFIYIFFALLCPNRGFRVTSGGLLRFLKGCGAGLERLNMLGCGTISDASLRHIALSCVRMTALDLSWCNISDTGIELLVEGSIEGLVSIKLQVFLTCA